MSDSHSPDTPKQGTTEWYLYELHRVTKALKTIENDKMSNPITPTILTIIATVIFGLLGVIYYSLSDDLHDLQVQLFEAESYHQVNSEMNRRQAEDITEIKKNFNAHQERFREHEREKH